MTPIPAASASASASVVLIQRKDAAPLPAAMQEALPSLLAQALGQPVRIVRDVEDYQVNFVRLGGWDAWARHLGAGTTVFGGPTYAALMLVEASMGRATTIAVNAALHVGRPVFLGEAGPQGVTLRRVVAIDRCEGNDYADWANAQPGDDFLRWCNWQIQFPKATIQGA